jgi:hypothetical protein
MSFQRLPEAFAGESRLRELQRQGLWLWQVQQALSEILPPEWCAQLSVGRFEGGQLTVMSPSALVVAKLKQMTPTLIAELSRRGFAVTAIRWRVRPELVQTLAQRPPLPSQAPRSLTPAAVAALSQLCTQLPADAPLAQSLTAWLRRATENAPAAGPQSQGNESFEQKQQ